MSIQLKFGTELALNFVQIFSSQFDNFNENVISRQNY